MNMAEALFELKENDREYLQLYLEDESMMKVIKLIKSVTGGTGTSVGSFLKDWPESLNGEFSQEADEPIDNKLPDISYWYRFFAFSQKAKDKLDDVLGGDIELLPVGTPEGIYYLYNIKELSTEIECDEDSSSQTLNLSLSRQLDCKNCLFIARINDADTYFCTDVFKETVEKEGLTGLSFIPRSKPVVL